MRKKYTITGIDCANCAAKLGAKMNDLPDVESVVLTFATEQLLVEAEDPDRVLPALQALADKMEPGTKITELVRGKKKTQHHQHEHEEHEHHHHDHCGCGGHDHEEHEHHHHDHCGCEEHEHHHHHDHCGCEEHEHHHHHDHCGCGEYHHEEAVSHEHKQLSGKVVKKKYRISGIDCANCAAKIEAKMNDLPDVNVTLTFATQQLCVEAKDPDALLPQLQALADKMEPGTKIENIQDSRSGAHQEEEGTPEDKEKLSEEKKEMIQIGIGAALFIAGEIFERLFATVPVASILCYVISYLILGGSIVLHALKNITKGKVFDENFLMSLATIGAFCIGNYPEAVGVMLFYRIGELFEDIAVNKSRRQIMDAVDMRPEIVRICESDRIVEVDPEEVEVGQIMEVRPGDRIPLDGVITKGESRIDTSAVTGEPVPVGVKAGDHVISGCVNTSGILYVKVEKPLEESMVTRILEAVENAAASKPKIDRFITKFARIYTPFVVILAVLTAIIPSLFTGEWMHWIYTALTFLVISCPCALVLSVPLAFFAGIGAGSKKGILFKGGVSLEMLASVKAIVMDKTGTVTEGNFKVEKIETEKGISEEELLALAACAESRSTHPIAVSIMAEAAARSIQPKQAQEMKELSGKGVSVLIDGHQVFCGNGKLMNEYQITMPAVSPKYGTEVYLAQDGKYIGRIVINDTIKTDSKEAIQSMKKQGLWTAMLTGDAEENAKQVAKETGIDQVYARQMPEDKLNNLSRIREEKGAVMFIGDGINDAPVLAGADVGAAMGSGADAAIEAADVVFMTSRLSAVNDSFAIAKKTSRIAMENVVGALIVKALVMILGLCGIASMWMAVFADSGVAMICVLNAVRILFQKRQ